MNKIDETAYGVGKRAWKRGTTLRTLVEDSIPTAEQEKDPEFNFNKHQNEHMSMCLGFADAALEWLRGGMRR